MAKLIAIGIGGFVGAIFRYLISGYVHDYYRGGFPLGTFAVNLLGCFLLGLTMHLVESRGPFGPQMRAAITIGLLGAFSTYSTFAYETFEMLREQQYGQVLLNTGGQVMLGLAAVWLGVVVARFIAS